MSLKEINAAYRKHAQTDQPPCGAQDEGQPVSGDAPTPESPENHESVRAALEKVGIADFSVRLKGQPADNAEDGLEALKKNFPDADIEVRR